MARSELTQAVKDEMRERGWDIYRVVTQALLRDPYVARMYKIYILTLEMILADKPMDGFVLDEKSAQLLADAFGVSAEFFLNLERAEPVLRMPDAANESAARIQMGEIAPALDAVRKEEQVTANMMRDARSLVGPASTNPHFDWWEWYEKQANEINKMLAAQRERSVK